MIQFLRKDLMLIVAHPSIILFALLIAAFFGAITHWVYYGSILITLMILFTILFLDVKYKADSFINSLPIRRRDVVLARYIEALCLSVIGLLFTLLFAVPYSFVTDSFSFSGVELYMTLGFDILIFTVFYPLYYQFGGVLTYISYFVFIGFLVGYAVSQYLLQFEDLFIFKMPGGVLMACILLLYVLSYFISVQVFRKKDI